MSEARSSVIGTVVAGRAETRKEGTIRRPTRLVDDVYDAIYGQLMSLRIPPDGRISVQGLVVKTHLVGYSAASQMDRRRFEELYELRLLLEPFAAARAATRLDERGLATLEAGHRTMQSMDGGGARQAYSDFARHDTEFHDLIATEGDNRLVRESLAALHTHVHLFRLHFHVYATTTANEEHGRILDALRRRDAASAEAAMRDHVERSRERFQTVFG